MLLSSKTNFSLETRQSEVSLQQYRRGEEISILDSGIWQVYRGVVQLSTVHQNGNETISGWVTADGVFGDVTDSPVFYRAIALGNVYVKHYSTHDVIRNPALGRQFLAQFSDRLVKSQQLLTIIAISKVEDRLRNLLVFLQQEIGQSVEDGVRLQVRFTHQHLAEAIHTTRVTITRILGDFQAQDLLYFDRDRHIVIHKKSYLALSSEI